MCIIYLILIYAWTWVRTCWWGQAEFSCKCKSFLKFNVNKEVYIGKVNSKQYSQFDWKYWILDTANSLTVTKVKLCKRPKVNSKSTHFLYIYNVVAL